MRMVFRTEINRSPSVVWDYVVKPENYQKWNDKVESMDVRGEFRMGEPFRTSYKWRDKLTQCMSVATLITNSRVLELRHSDFVGVGVNPSMVAIERIILKERQGRTLVTRVISIRNHGMPLILVPVFWFVSRFGRPKDPDPLKLMCESNTQTL